MSEDTTYPVRLRSLTVGYGTRLLVESADVGFPAGCFTALVGRNGTGKSTLLRTIAGLAAPIKGSVEIFGRDIAGMDRREIAARIAFVSTEEVRIADLKVMDVVALGRAPYTNWMGSLSPEDKECIGSALELVGMGGFARKCIANLSDGERQRVMIARALAQDTGIILLDEPTAFLDLPNKYEICMLLHRLADEQGKCILSTTHDLSIALELCDAVAMIDRGSLLCDSTDSFISSGLVERLFDDTRLTFDRTTRSIKLK